MNWKRRQLRNFRIVQTEVSHQLAVSDFTEFYKKHTKEDIGTKGREIMSGYYGVISGQAMQNKAASHIECVLLMKRKSQGLNKGEEYNDCK